MLITEVLARNAEMYGQEKCLTEINMALQEEHHVTWLEYKLIENNPAGEYRRDMTWRVFDEKANRLANLLIKRGIKKGDKVAILLMNCLEWLPIYFGILKAGAIVVPLNFRYTAEEIKYCLDLSETGALIFGPEFIGRWKQFIIRFQKWRQFFFAGKIARLLQKIMTVLRLIVLPRLRKLNSRMKMKQLYIFLRAQRDFRKQFYILIGA